MQPATKCTHRMDRPYPYAATREGVAVLGTESLLWQGRKSVLVSAVLGATAAVVAWYYVAGGSEAGVPHYQRRGAADRNFAAAPAVTHHVRGRLPAAEGHARLQQARPRDRDPRGGNSDQPRDSEEDLLCSHGRPPYRRLAHGHGRVSAERVERGVRAAFACAHRGGA